MPKTSDARHFGARTLCALAILFVVGCASVRTHPWLEAPAAFDAAKAGELLANDWLGMEGVAMLRLEGRLEIGSRKLRLSAIVRRDGGNHVARVVVMGDMGLTICDLDVTPSGHITHSVAPDLKKAPSVVRHIARTFRRMLLLPLPENVDTAGRYARTGEYMLAYETAGVGAKRAKSLLQRIYAAPDTENAGRLTGLSAPDAEWELAFSDWQPAGNMRLPWPRRLAYHDASGGYTIHALLVSFAPEEAGN